MFAHIARPQLGTQYQGQEREGKNQDYWLMIRRKTRGEQKIRAERLVDETGVVIPKNGCGLPEIHKFREFYSSKNVAILVHNFQPFGRGEASIYDGTQCVRTSGYDMTYTIRIIFMETARHYRPILNLIAAASSQGLCEKCNIAYTREIDHGCAFKSCKFMQKSDCDISNELVYCPQCR